jgi:hypothetical protein
MARSRPGQRRVKIGATLDPVILAAIDGFIRQHPELDRSSVIDDALHLWWARQQEREMADQFSETPSSAEHEEHQDWRRIQDAAAGRIFGDR